MSQMIKAASSRLITIRLLFVCIMAVVLGLLPAIVLAETPESATADGVEDLWADETIPTVTAEGVSLQSFRISGSALKPRESDVSYTVGSGGACTYVTSGDASTVWNHAVNLPQGSVIDTLRMYYFDTSASNSSAWFTVYDLYGSIVEEWSVSTSVSSGNSFNDSAFIGHQIDYNVYSYLINWRPVVTGSTMQLCGFRIFYVPPDLIFSDGFESGNTSAWN